MKPCERLDGEVSESFDSFGGPQSVSHTPGQGFPLEKDLCDALVRTLMSPAWGEPALKFDGMVRERPVRNVVPDLVCVGGRDGVGDALPCVPLTAFEAHVVASLLPGEPMTPSAIASALWSHVERVEISLRVLEKRRLVKWVSGACVAMRMEVIPRDLRIMAVEAKLARWRDALRQAQAYLPFANEAFVAMPIEVATGNRALRASARAAGIGVLGVDNLHTVVVEPAQGHRPQSGDWVWLLSRLVRLPGRDTVA